MTTMGKVVVGLLVVGFALVISIMGPLLLNGGFFDEGAGVEVAYTRSECPAETPLLIKVTNRLPIALDSYTVQLSATRSGHSSLVRKFNLSSDRILSGWSSTSECWSADYVGRVLEYGESEAEWARYKKDMAEDAELIWSAKVVSAKY